MTDLTEVLARAIEEACSGCDPRDRAAFANAAQSALAALDAAGYQIVPKEELTKLYATIEATKADVRRLSEKLDGLKWAVCESEILRDPALSGKDRELLTEIANLSSAAPKP